MVGTVSILDGSAMKRIDIVAQGLAKHGTGDGITAGDLAAALGLSRANVSSDLNRLCEEGRACKSGVRPVYYKPADGAPQARRAESSNHDAPAPQAPPEPDALDVFARKNPSMFHSVEQAKAAVLYPPHGMHMLFHGVTGVGKSMFARMVFDYAVSANVLAADAPFVAFNCADYADNPQLLVSELMGTRRGAFTGADEDQPGFIEKANNGILFLDEVHRLPPQGQEMLFTFIDRGVYRRLGETGTERSAQALIICATTEDPSSNLLATFVRRIPMLIEIPSLSSRSREERFTLIERFFMDESARLQMPINVSTNSIRALLGYSCPGNVGQLKNDIRIICARAYSRLIGGRKTEMRVASHDLPQHVLDGLYGNASRTEVWRRRLATGHRYCVFDASEEPAADISLIDEGLSIYDVIDERMRQLRFDNVDEDEASELLDDDIRKFFSKYAVRRASAETLGSPHNMVSPEVADVADEILALAAERLDRTFDDSVRYGLASHIASAVLRVRDGLSIVNPQFNKIRKRLPKEFSVALEAAGIIEERFDVELPLDEAGFITLFFNVDAARPRANVLVIVVAHGRSTASSMVETANRLAGMEYAIGIDASLEEMPSQVYERVLEVVRDRATGAGVLLLVDMGSLTSFAGAVQRDAGIPVRVIPLVSTMHVVEASRKASLGAALDDVYAETMQVSTLLGEVEQPAPREASAETAHAFVVAICTTGKGGAEVMKRTFDDGLNYHNGFAETVTVPLVAEGSITSRLDEISRRGRIVCIASTFDVGYPAPHIALSDVFGGNGITQIQELIENELNVVRVGDTLAGLLANVDTRRLAPKVTMAANAMEETSGRRLLPEVRIGFICHLVCMFDRLAGSSEHFVFEGLEETIASDRVLYEAILAALAPVARELGVSVSDDEACFCMQFWAPENCFATA